MSSEREDRLRAELKPLGAHEWPRPLIVAIAVAVVVAVAVIVGVFASKHLAHDGGSVAGGVFIAAALLVLALSMYRRRYWAVLGFEALLGFQVIVASLALIVAGTLLDAGLCALSIGLGGWLFWKLVRVMSRIQAPDRDARPPE